MPLKCPSCGAPLSRESSRCEFCGTELLLVQDGSGFQEKQIAACSHCGRPLGAGSWLCPKCGTPVPGNEQRLRELHKKQQYLQDDVKKESPHIVTVLEPGEYVEFIYRGGFGYFAVTEKRLLTYAKKGLFGDKIFNQYDWSEVAAVGNVTYNRDVRIYQLEVQTLDGPRYLRFGADGQVAYRFQREIASALNRHNTGQRDVRALIWVLNMDSVGKG